MALPPPPSASSLFAPSSPSPSAPSTGFAHLPAALPLVYIASKSISSVQAPGSLNWERVGGSYDSRHFVIVDGGVLVVREGTYQINVDVEHSEAREAHKRVFRVWAGKRVLGQCSFPQHTRRGASLSLWEQRVTLPVGALVRVEFLAGGFAFHERSRLVLRLVY